MAKDRRTVDELSIEELEEILRVRKAQARVERIRKSKGAMPVVDPLAPEPVDPSPRRLPEQHRQFREQGATAGFRARPVDEEESPRRREPRKLEINWAWVRDRSLLVIELTALFSLLAVVAYMVFSMQAINEESRAAQQSQLPTPTPVTPTPQIQVALLPGGHTPPDASGQSEPEPVPAHLQHLVSSITPMPAPTPGPEHATRIRIPIIDVDAPVIEGDDWESLKRGAGHHIGSANPGERGNCVISAHNDIYGEIFRRLPDLELGDLVEVYTESQVYRYEVTQKRIIEPTEVSVLYPTSTPVLTLISCYPYGIDTHRIVVIGDLQP